MQAVKVLPKGQITLPKKVRKELGINIGDTLLIEEQNNILILTKGKTIFDYSGALPDLGLSIERIIEKAAEAAAEESA